MVWGSKSIRFNPEKDIPSLRGKVILVTGGNAGLGRQAVLEFARHDPAQIWLAARSIEKATAAADEIKKEVAGAHIKTLIVDLASFDSIKAAAKNFLAQSDRLDILMLNAGIMAAQPGLTAEGYEVQFGTNHMGHALVTKLLLPILTRTAASSPGSDVRVISVASHGHTYVAEGDFRFDTPKTLAEGLGAFGRYSQSKLANVLWARHLARLYPQLTVASVDPGVTQTQLMEGAKGSPLYIRVLVKMGYGLLKSVSEGVKNQLWASVSTDVASGEYYESVGVGGKASANGTDDGLAKKLWDWTDKELEGIDFTSDDRGTEYPLEGNGMSDVTA